MRAIILTLALFILPLMASGRTYPQCGSGAPQACTVVVTVTNVSTPIFAAFPSRQYLVIENQGFLTTTGQSP